MVTRHHPTTGPSAAHPPFDASLSRRIDAIIIRLETTRPKTISRGIVQFQKRIAERNVPAWKPEVRA